MMAYLILVLLLTSCGQANFSCEHVYSDTVTRRVGTLEPARCELGEVIVGASVEYAPGGVAKWLNVQCAKLATVCD